MALFDRFKRKPKDEPPAEHSEPPPNPKRTRQLAIDPTTGQPTESPQPGHPAATRPGSPHSYGNTEVRPRSTASQTKVVATGETAIAGDSAATRTTPTRPRPPVPSNDATREWAPVEMDRPRRDSELTWVPPEPAADETSASVEPDTIPDATPAPLPDAAPAPVQAATPPPPDAPPVPEPAPVSAPEPEPVVASEPVSEAPESTTPEAPTPPETPAAADEPAPQAAAVPPVAPVPVDPRDPAPVDVEAKTRHVATAGLFEGRLVGVLAVIEGDLEGEIFKVREGENELGRARGCPVQLVSEVISREHAVVTHQGGVFAVRPLSPDNPTLKNDEKITERVPLADGDTIQLGRTKLLFRSLV